MSCTLTQRVLHVTETGNIQGFQVTTATALQYHPLYFFQQAYASDGKHRTPMTGLALYPPHNHIACYALSSKTPPMLKYNALTVPYTHWLVGSSPCFYSPSSLWQKGFKANNFQLHTGQFFRREEKRWCHPQRCKDRNFCGLLNINTWISATETKAIIKANNPS